MIIPDMYTELYSTLTERWREEIEQADDRDFVKRENEVKTELEEKLDDSTKKLAALYGATVKLRYEHTFYEICRRLFLFSVKAGMDMQKAFDVES